MSRRTRRDTRAAAERRARRRSFLMVVAIGVVLLVVAAAAFALVAGGGGLDTEAAPVENYPYPELRMLPPDPGGRAHFAAGEAYDAYNSNPPTSGPHTATVEPGAYDTPVPKESAVHNMEHGQVVVWYNCNAGPQPRDEAACVTLLQQLAAIVTEANNGGKRVLMTPYAAMDHRIALTAWQFLDEFDEFDAQRVRTFIDTFYCHTNLEGFC
jgi:hypothetical protein